MKKNQPDKPTPSSKRYTPSGFSEWLVPIMLVVLALILLGVLLGIGLAVFGVL